MVVTLTVTLYAVQDFPFKMSITSSIRVYQSRVLRKLSEGVRGLALGDLLTLGAHAREGYSS